MIGLAVQTICDFLLIGATLGFAQSLLPRTSRPALESPPEAAALDPAPALGTEGPNTVMHAVSCQPSIGAQDDPPDGSTQDLSCPLQQTVEHVTRTALADITNLPSPAARHDASCPTVAHLMPAVARRHASRPVPPDSTKHDDQSLDTPGVLSAARCKPQSKQHAFRLGAAPYAPPEASHPGLQRPLYLSGHFRVEEPQTLGADGSFPNPYTSFDAVNGPITLAAEPEWSRDEYIVHALDVARLPGTPTARFLTHEVIDHPGPQIVLTQDHGPARLRAVVCDFRPLQGRLEVIESQPTSSVLDLIQASRSIRDPDRALRTATGLSCTTLVNGVIVPPGQVLPHVADLVLFQLWTDGVPANTWRPFVLGDARPPVPPIPEDAFSPGVTAQQATVTHTGATSSQPAAIPRHTPVHLRAPADRYSYLDTVEGVNNRPKPLDGSDHACLQDALVSVPRRGTPMWARLIHRPLTGLFTPQVLLSRVSHRAGWHTIAIDLRQINLGIKVTNVVLGTSIRQLLDVNSGLYAELAQLGRGNIPFTFLVNLEPCVIDVAFHMHTDTLTLLPIVTASIGTAIGSNAEPSQRWARRLGVPRTHATGDDVEQPLLYTVYDTVHHFRTFSRDEYDTVEILIAKAISVTPEIADAEGHVLIHGIADMPTPQIVLVSRHKPCCVVPLLYKLQPISICTSEVPRNAAAFEVALCASKSCRALTGAPQQIARRTALITGHHGSDEPYKPGCVREHEALVLRGFVFGIPRPRLRSSSANDWIEARQSEPHEDYGPAELRMIRVLTTRGRQGCVHVEPTVSMRHTCDYILAHSPAGPTGRLCWPVFVPAMPGAVPVVVHVTAEASDEARRWALVDVRRVGHPPLLPFQTVPLPSVVEVSTVVNMLRHELPSLRPIAGVYLDDRVLTDSPTATTSIMTITLLGQAHQAAHRSAALVPALDMNVDLMESRTALLAHFNSFPPTAWPDRLAESISGSARSSITEDHTDASASFRSGSISDDLDSDGGIPLFGPAHTTTSSTLALGTSPLSTTTSTTTPAELGSFGNDSPQPRFCNIVSTPSDIAHAHICVFAVCGHCRPCQINVRTAIPVDDLLTRFTVTFADMGILPDAAHWLFSQRAHWLHDGRLAIFLATGWGSTEPFQSSVWVEPGHRWATPFMISVPLLASRPQIEALITLPDVGLLVMTVNGVIWDGTERPFHNGDVLQLRSTWHRLGSLPIHVLDERLRGIAAAQCHCDGPVGVRDLCDAPRRRDPKIRQHFADWLESFQAAPSPSHEFNNFYLVVHGGPLLRVSVGSRLPPARADVQAFYDEHFGVAFGPRIVEDTRFAWNDTCVYVARTAAYPSQLWLLLGGPRLDCIQLESSQDLSQIPAPPDYVWFPSESRGNIGIAFLQPIQHAADRPSTQHLYDLPVRPPDAPPESGSPITDGSLPPGSHTMRSIFGTSSEGFQDDFAGLASPSRAQGTYPASDLGGSDSSSSGSSSSSTSAEAGISLLQQRTHISRLVLSNTSPAGTPLIGHAATRDGTSDAEEDMRLQVWQPGLPPVLLSLPGQCRTFEVDQALAAQGVRLQAIDLVPAFPPAANLSCSACRDYRQDMLSSSMRTHHTIR